MSTVQENSSLLHFYDRLDEFEEGDPMDCVAEDVELDMMFPGRKEYAAGERFSGGRKEYEEFRQNLLASHVPFRRNESGSLRRHNVDTLVKIDGLELMVGRGLNGTRNGAIFSAVEPDGEGKLLKYAFVMSSVVELSAPEDRVTPEPGLIERFFDRQDGISMEDPLELLSSDFTFEMVFPGIDGPPDERISGSRADFEAFMNAHLARRPRKPVSQEERRHHLRTSTVVDGIEIFVGQAINGRRNGTVFALAEADREGKIRRFIAAMAPAVHFSEK
jgi:hypothetical protein